MVTMLNFFWNRYGDIEQNPCTEIDYKNIFKVSENYEQYLHVAQINFQNVPIKHVELKSVVNDLEKCYCGYI